MQEITSKAVILFINSFAVIVKMGVGSFMILDDFSYVIFEVPGWHFLRGSMHFLSACSQITFMEFSVPCSPIMPPRLYFQEKLQEVFVMLVVVILPRWRLPISMLLFYVISTPSWLLRSVNASISSQLYPGYFRLLTFVWLFCCQFCLVLPRVLQF